MKISLIIPMYNESAIIADTARRLSDYMDGNFDQYEILFCDDGSNDGCGELVKRLDLKNVRVIGYEKNRGKGCAIRHGVLAADGDVIMFTDADLAYGTDVIRAFCDRLTLPDCVSMVIGSRNLDSTGYEGYSFKRKIASKAYIRILCAVGGFRLSDSQCGCKAFEKTAAKDIFSRCHVDGFAFDFEAILWAQALGYRIEEQAVKILYHHESKVRLFRDSVKMLKDLRKIRKEIKNKHKRSVTV